MSPSNSSSVTTSLSTSMLLSVSQSASPSVSNAVGPSSSQLIAPSSTQQTSPDVSSSVSSGDGTNVQQTFDDTSALFVVQSFITLTFLSRDEWVGYSLTFTLRVCR